ncbi:hypothetical protein ACMATS_05815 [Streptoverticillium reticulum]|uniref:hypothetical protein n=1 Tax=Streptoverticillium reticulum TaxID=1433415 RepID=UPI0039BF55CA
MGRQKKNKPKPNMASSGRHWADEMPDAHAEPSLWIESVRRDPGALHEDEPSCLLTWGELQWYAPVEAVRQTATDLMTSASYAELIAVLMRLGLDGAAISAMVSDAMTQALGDRTPYQGMFGTEHTISVMPGGSSARKAGVVMLRRGGTGGAVTPAGAREMAGHWMAVATGTEYDEIAAAALDDILGVAGEEASGVFAYMRALRDVEGAELEEFRRREGVRARGEWASPTSG